MRLPLVLVTAAIAGPLLIAQPAAPSFEVASIKPVDVNPKKGGKEMVKAPPGNLNMQDVSLRSCLAWAYSVKDYQIIGPAWLGNERFDIIAKAAPDTPVEQMRLMLQTLLAERFKVALHHEPRELPVFVMVADKKGLKLHESKSDEAAAVKYEGGTIILTNHTMEQVAARLSTPMFGVGRPVLDQTGATGKYDFEIELAASIAEMKMSIERKQTDPDPRPVQDALARVGVRMELRKDPVDALVIERAEKIPTEN
jgi:uncharacterized protein (TIGR03435 family)